MKKVLVIGSINTDMTVSTPRMPKLGETVTGSGYFSTSGGKGANQAVALVKQGAQVKMLGVVGNDANGAECIANLKRNNVEFEGEIIDNAATGIAFITVCGGDNCIILHEGANSCLSPEIVEKRKELFDWADVVVMQLEIPLESVIQACKTAKKHNCVTVLNPAPAKEIPDELLKYSDIIIPNEHEASIITNISCVSEEDYIKAAGTLIKKGVGSVIITLGDKGYMYMTGEKTEFKKAYDSKAVDTTAAGDSFIGAFISEYDGDDSFEKAADYAAKVSSITVSRPGASVSIPTRQETEKIFS